MPAGTIERVEQDAVRVVRHQPRAHSAWQFFYWNGRFRRAIGDFDTLLYELRVDAFDDCDLDIVIEAVDAVRKTIEVHVSRLGDGLRDTIDREYFKPILQRLAVAREGLSQGLNPDPAKRPSNEQLLDELAEMLRRPA